MLGTPEAALGRAASTEPFQERYAAQILAVLLKLPILTSPMQVLSAETLETLFRWLATMDTPEAVHGRAASTETFQAVNALPILALLLKFPILTSQLPVLSAETLELLFRWLAMLDTPEAVHGRAVPTEPFQERYAVPMLALQLKLPTLISPVQVLSLETLETLFRLVVMLDTPEAVLGRAAPTEPLQVQDAAKLLALLLKLPTLISPVQVLSLVFQETLFRSLATLDTKAAVHGHAVPTEPLQVQDVLL